MTCICPATKEATLRPPGSMPRTRAWLVLLNILATDQLPGTLPPPADHLDDGVLRHCPDLLAKGDDRFRKSARQNQRCKRGTLDEIRDRQVDDWRVRHSEGVEQGNI